MVVFATLFALCLKRSCRKQSWEFLCALQQILSPSCSTTRELFARRAHGRACQCLEEGPFNQHPSFQAGQQGPAWGGRGASLHSSVRPERGKVLMKGRSSSNTSLFDLATELVFPRRRGLFFSRIFPSPGAASTKPGSGWERSLGAVLV